MSRGGGFNRRGRPKGQKGPAAQFLPNHMLMLFEPPPPLVFKEPFMKPPARKVDGITAFLSKFESGPPPAREMSETPLQRRTRRVKAAVAANAAAVEERLASWKPKEDDKATKDAFNTLFVARLAFETDEAKLRAEMESVGPVNSVRIVKDGEGKSRGYAFVEFTTDADLKAAYKRFNGYIVDGRRILADVERGRTVPSWRPRRLGGGLGATRKALPKGTKNAVPPGGAASMANAKALSRTVGSRYGGGPPPPRDGRMGGGPPPYRGGDRYGGGQRGGYNRGPPPGRGYGGDRGGYSRGPPPGRGGGYDRGPPPGRFDRGGGYGSRY